MPRSSTFHVDGLFHAVALFWQAFGRDSSINVERKGIGRGFCRFCTGTRLGANAVRRGERVASDDMIHFTTGSARLVGLCM